MRTLLLQEHCISDLAGIAGKVVVGVLRNLKIITLQEVISYTLLGVTSHLLELHPSF